MHDAEGAHHAILNAAEVVFAEHGFDGARIDAIAARSGYNKSLIFQYFDDKLGIYAAVIRQVDEQTREVQTWILDQLSAEKGTPSKERIYELFKPYMRAYFDYLVRHPRMARILMWEMAEGWQIYGKITSEKDLEDVKLFSPILDKLMQAGILRSGFDPMSQVVLVEFLFPCYLAIMPLNQMLMPDKDLYSPEALEQAREFLIEFIANGLLAGPLKAN